MERQSFLVLSANSPWTYGMTEALAEKHFTHAIQFYDWVTYKRRPMWSVRVPPPFLQRSMPVLPTGYAGRLEKVFRLYLQFLMTRWCRHLQKVSGVHPWVIASEPYNSPWVRHIPSKRLIYYNFDDYTLYRPEQKEKILKQEEELIHRSTIILCASYFQTITLREKHPKRASSIHHYPHGFVNNYLNPHPEIEPDSMTVGYVGNLGDRLDWKLILEVIKASPEVIFIFVGGLDEQIMIEQGNWQSFRQQVLSLSNVRHVGRVSPDQVAGYYWTFAVNWIPYLVSHPFNEAACPTKIMDGIASGQPVLSTEVPECRLYPEWIKIFTSAEQGVALIKQNLALSNKSQAVNRRIQQLEFAKTHTWQERAKTLEHFLSQYD